MPSSSARVAGYRSVSAERSSPRDLAMRRRREDNTAAQLQAQLMIGVPRRKSLDSISLKTQQRDSPSLRTCNAAKCFASKLHRDMARVIGCILSFLALVQGWSIGSNKLRQCGAGESGRCVPARLGEWGT